MIDRLTDALASAGLRDRDRSGPERVSGDIAMQGVGLVRCVAGVEQSGPTVTLRWMPLRLEEPAGRAVSGMLATATRQIAGIDVAAGVDRERGVVWLTARCREEALLDDVRVSLALARMVFARAAALCEREQLARAWVRLHEAPQTPGQAEPCEAREEVTEDGH